jgi:hypothetical protein
VRFLMAMAGSLMLMLALVGPVAASGCQAWGMQNHDFYGPGALGALVSGAAPRSDVLGPGTKISDIVHFEQTWLYCAP